jgi:hypothetical protein
VIREFIFFGQGLRWHLANGHVTVCGIAIRSGTLQRVVKSAGYPEPMCQTCAERDREQAA